jgi:hypothetical protein
MEEIISQLRIFQKTFDQKSQKKYGIQHQINLANKLDKKVDDFVKSQMTLLINELIAIQSENKNKNEYFNVFKQLKKYVKATFGFVPKGSVQAEYLTFGIAFGVLIGVAFIAVNSVFIAIGLPIGVALGLSLGSSKEKE